MPTTDLSIAHDAVVDFSCAGWPEDKRAELQQAITPLPGIKHVGGAGISTVRVRYDETAITRDNLILAVDQLADGILSGYNFSAR